MRMHLIITDLAAPNKHAFMNSKLNGLLVLVKHLITSGLSSKIIFIKKQINKCSKLEASLIIDIKDTIHAIKYIFRTISNSNSKNYSFQIINNNLTKQYPQDIFFQIGVSMLNPFYYFFKC